MKIIVGENSQKNRIPQNHAVIILMLISLFFVVMGSRWTILAFNIPEGYSKGLTLFLYLMLMVFVLVKLCKDICTKKISYFSIFLLIFLFYCVCVMMIRLMSGEEIQHTIYCTLILIGSISIANIIFNKYKKKKIKIETIVDDFIAFGYILVAFKLCYNIFLSEVFLYDMINVNKECCIMLMLIPCSFLGYLIYERKKYVIGILLFSTMIIYSGSRSGTFLWFLELLTICFLLVRHNFKIYKMMLCIFFFVLVTAGLLIFDVGNIQQYFSRATGMFFFNTSLAIDVEGQISRSDAGRFELYDWGYTEFLKSPIIGTGVVYFFQTIEGMGDYMQSSHNFVLEILDCFGLLGLVQVIILFIAMLLQIPKNNGCKSYFIILSLVFFGYAMFQPFIYDPLAFLTYCVSVLICVIISNESIGLYNNRKSKDVVLIREKRIG